MWHIIISLITKGSKWMKRKCLNAPSWFDMISDLLCSYMACCYISTTLFHQINIKGHLFCWWLYSICPPGSTPSATAFDSLQLSLHKHRLVLYAEYKQTRFFYLALQQSIVQNPYSTVNPKTHQQHQKLSDLGFSQALAKQQPSPWTS